jgi:hypothetical protein
MTQRSLLIGDNDSKFFSHAPFAGTMPPRFISADIMKGLTPHLLAVLIGLVLAGCASSAEKSKQSNSKQSSAFGASSPDGRPIDPEVLQRDVMNFADRFAGSMADAYDQIAAARTSSPAVQGAALERKIGNVSAAYVNATEFNPMVGLIEMMVMVTLLRDASQEPWFSEAVGAAEAAKVVSVLKEQEEDIWGIGARYLSQSQLAELRGAIEGWRKNHPDQRYVSSVRLADFPEAKSPRTASAKGPTSVFSLLFLDPLAGLDPTTREVIRSREAAERMFFYAQRMPVLLSWQSEALSRRVLDLPRAQQIGSGAARFGDFADSARMIANALEKFPKTLADERQRTVDVLAQKMSEQRAAAVKQAQQALAVERDAALKQSSEVMAAQRDAAIKQLADAVATERKTIVTATTQSVANEREAIVAAWNQSLASQRQALIQDMETASGRAVNRFSFFAGVVVTLGILLAALAVLFVRRAAPKAPLRRLHRLPSRPTTSPWAATSSSAV